MSTSANSPTNSASVAELVSNSYSCQTMDALLDSHLNGYNAPAKVKKNNSPYFIAGMEVTRCE